MKSANLKADALRREAFLRELLQREAEDHKRPTMCPSCGNPLNTDRGEDEPVCQVCKDVARLDYLSDQRVEDGR